MIKGRYFCLNQNPIRLVFYLYFFSKALQLHPGIIRISPFSVVRRLIQIRLRISKGRNITELPFYGNLCLPVHQGFKIFNFRKKTVIKLILPEVDESVVINEIEMVKKTSFLNFAPKLRDWNIDDRWYEEDFIHGSPFYPNPRSETNISLKIFDRKILPCLKEMILLQRAQKIALHDYVEDIKKKITQRLISMSLIQQPKCNAIRRFLKTNHRALLEKNNSKVPLVFSHGDFSLVNILNTKVGIKVIDWEGADFRNPLYDLYNYFFTELYYKRISDKISSEVIKAIGSLKAFIFADLPEIGNSLVALSEIYLMLYYLERLDMLLMRDESENVLNVIFNSMELFDSFETFK